MEFMAGAPGGEEKLQRSLALARRAGLHEHVALAYLDCSSRVPCATVVRAR